MKISAKPALVRTWPRTNIEATMITAGWPKLARASGAGINPRRITEIKVKIPTKSNLGRPKMKKTRETKTIAKTNSWSTMPLRSAQ